MHPQFATAPFPRVNCSPDIELQMAVVSLRRYIERTVTLGLATTTETALPVCLSRLSIAATLGGILQISSRARRLRKDGAECEKPSNSKAAELRQIFADWQIRYSAPHSYTRALLVTQHPSVLKPYQFEDPFSTFRRTSLQVKRSESEGKSLGIKSDHCKFQQLYV